MQISVTDAKAQLTELVRRAEAGDEIVLTRHGEATVRLVPVRPARLSPAQRHAVLAAVRGSGEHADAAQSQDFLYDERGLPR